MEHTALFIWLVLCLLMGALIHYIMDGAMQHEAMQYLAAPGTCVRKFSQALAALVFGGTVTQSAIYETDPRDTAFEAEGTSSIAKVLVPLAPLFGCAVAMGIMNSVFGNPFRLDYQPPELASFDAGGLRGHVTGTWALLMQVVRRGISVDWGNPRLYVLFALTFSLAYGAATPWSELREAVIGTALVTITLAVLSVLGLRSGFLGLSRPLRFAKVLKDAVVSYSAAAFVMMVYGLLTTLAVGIAVRVYELITRTRSGGRTVSLPRKRRGSRAA
jgi:hypothetical protein